MSRDHASAASPAAAQPGVARVGKYLMLDLLGEGAFGKVRLAVDESSGKEYAMKIMAKSHIKANELTLQVRREIAVMKAMRHPNIVNLHEVLTSSKNIYMVMDLVTGGELFDAVAEHGRLSEARTRLYFQQLVDGIHYCHTRRVYHRDLKPENLLLSGDKQFLKITDFGLSSIKAQNASSELLHTIMGSPHYIAPEIITSAAEGYEGSKVDVWAAGIILFGMLAGFLPFDEANTKGLYKAIVHSPIQYPPHFSYDVIKLLRAMLQKDPNRRPSMEQVKFFAWFKVDYEPAIVPEETHSPQMEDRQARKTRSKSKKKDERGAKLRRRDPSIDRESRKSVDKLFTESGEKARGGKLGEVSLRHRKPVSKRASGLFRSTSRKISVGSEQLSQRGSVDASEVRSVNQNNADIRQPQVEEIQRDEEGRNEQLSTAPVDEAQVKSLRQAKSGAVVQGVASECLFEEQMVSPNEERDGVGLVTLQSNRSFPDSVPCSRFSAVANTAPSEGEELSPEAERSFPERQQKNQEHVELDPPSGKGDTNSEREKGHNIIPDSKREVDADPDLSSPLTAGESHFSPVNSGCNYTGSVSSMQQGRQESLRFSGNKLTGHESGLSDFISPVSLQSQSSFSSLHPEGPHAPLLSPDYRSLVPKLFQSGQNRLDSERKEKNQERVDQSKVEAEQEQSTGAYPEPPVELPFVDASTTLEKTDSQAGPGRSAEEVTIETDAEDKELGIFKPMKSVFATLVQQTSAEKKPNMAPSVYCPEVDNDAESGPEWCIDSMEVFADMEGEDPDHPKTGRSTPSQKLLEILKQRQATMAELSGTDLDSFNSLNGMSRSIFAPLDDKLAFTLIPSAEAEELATKAVRKLPLIRPAL